MSAPGQTAASIRQQVIYTGRVQGVGFRMSAYQIADNFQVTGWVRNLSDGTVELEAQGASAEIERFLAAIAKEFAGNIRSTDSADRPVLAGETTFTIRY